MSVCRIRFGFVRDAVARELAFLGVTSPPPRYDSRFGILSDRRSREAELAICADLAFAPLVELHSSHPEKDRHRPPLRNVGTRNELITNRLTADYICSADRRTYETVWIVRVIDRRADWWHISWSDWQLGCFIRWLTCAHFSGNLATGKLLYLMIDRWLIYNMSIVGVTARLLTRCNDWQVADM